MKKKEPESKDMNIEDEIQQLKFEIATLHKGYHNMQIKIGELEMLIRGARGFEDKELQ